MKKIYFAFVFAEDDGSYTCTFPDIDGLRVTAATFEELLEAARSGVEAELQRLKDAGQAFPACRTFPEVSKLTWREERNVSTIVPVTVYQKDEPIRINITSTVGQIEEITDIAKSIGKTRSEFMVSASLQYVREHS